MVWLTLLNNGTKRGQMEWLLSEVFPHLFKKVN